MAGLYGELVVDRANNTINGKPWPKLEAVISPLTTVRFWELSEGYVAEIAKFPVAWYLDAIKKLTVGIEDLEPARLADAAALLEAYAKRLHVRVMDELTKDAPARKPKP